MSAFPWPAQRFGHLLAYESGTGQVVLHGGRTPTGGIETVTWVYDYTTNRWTDRDPASAPSPRVGTSLVYDSESDRFVLFGGLAAHETLNETWVYNLRANAWTQMHPAMSPPARYDHAMAYDESADRVILFGGSDGIIVSSTVLDETWAYDLNKNTWTNRNPSPRPSARAAFGMVYDAQARRVVLEGGRLACDTNIVPNPACMSGETWAYDFSSNAWTQRATGPVRVEHGLVYDHGSRRTLLFGGTQPPHDPPTGFAWSFDFASNMWSEIPPSSSPPHSYALPAIYASHADRVVFSPSLYNPTPNYDPTDEIRGAIWLYDFDSNVWSSLLPPPFPGIRSSFGLSDDTHSSRVILFGGMLSGSSTPSGDTWAYDAALQTWSRLTPSVAPSPRSDPGMVYASRYDRVLLFGGDLGSLTTSDETWLFDYDQELWSNPNPSPRPPPRRSLGLAYDSITDRAVLFGGMRSWPPYVHLNDTWTYDVGNNTWSNVTPAFGPAAREGHSMVYASRSGKVVLFGGANPNNLSVGNETWLYDPQDNEWTRVEPSTAPAARWYASMAYNVAADRVILFGGAPPGRDCCSWHDDTWALDVANGSWLRLDLREHPGGRSNHRLVYAMGLDQAILYGGTASDDTWSFAYAAPVEPGSPVWSAPDVADRRVELHWFPPESTGGTTILNYRIYRGTVPGDAAFLATTPYAGYTDWGLENGDPYYYRVSAVNGIGEGVPSTELSVTPRTTPSSPRNLRAVSGDNQIFLFWDAPDSDGGARIENYSVYRRTEAEYHGRIAAVERGQMYADHSVEAGVQYSYWVTASNAVGESWPPSNLVEVTGPTSSSVRVSLSASPRSGTPPLMVGFIATATGQAPLALSWDFGDGRMSEAPSPVHTYTSLGTYFAVVQVSDSVGGRSANVTQIWVVETVFTVAISMNRTAGPAPLAVAFAVTASGGEEPYLFAWDFGDGGTSGEQGPVHVFTQKGSFTVSVTVTDRTGLPVTRSTVIHVAGETGRYEGLWFPLGLSAGLAIVGIATYVLIRRRRRPPRGADPL